MTIFHIRSSYILTYSRRCRVFQRKRISNYAKPEISFLFDDEIHKNDQDDGEVIGYLCEKKRGKKEAKGILISQNKKKAKHHK